jgi:hypothetical protein
MSCAPLYRTYQVAKGLVFIIPLGYCALATCGIHLVGSGICAPIEYVVNGNVEVSINQINQRTDYMRAVCRDAFKYIIE